MRANAQVTILIPASIDRASPYVHSRQPKTMYLKPNLTLAPQSDPKTNPKPCPNPDHIAKP